MFRGGLSERGIERGLADFDASRSFANRKTLGDKRLRAPELFVSHWSWNVLHSRRAPLSEGIVRSLSSNESNEPRTYRATATALSAR